MLPETPPVSPSAPPMYPVVGGQGSLSPLLMTLLVVIGMGLVSAGLAQRKGYSPYAWILAAGIFGWLFIAVLPPVNAGALGDQETIQARNRGNLLGVGLSVFSAIVGVSLLLLF